MLYFSKLIHIWFPIWQDTINAIIFQQPLFYCNNCKRYIIVLLTTKRLFPLSQYLDSRNILTLKNDKGMRFQPSKVIHSSQIFKRVIN